jgi:hypothetical protein
MNRDAGNISTDHQPKGSDRNQSDTLDKPEAPDAHVAERTDRSPAKPGTPDVVDEKDRPLNGDGTTKA